MKEEAKHCIRDLVKNLPLNYQIIIYLSELKEFPIGEVGRILGISPGSAKIRLHGASRMLKALMERNCRILLDDASGLQCDRKTEA